MTGRQIALDTNAYTAVGRGSQKISSLLREAVDVGIPVAVLGEIYFGSFNGNQPQKSQTVLRNFLADERVHILHIDEHTARLFGEISTELKRIGKPIQQNDIWIASLCKQHDYTLVTNDKGFAGIIGLSIITY